jgi:hypothetical protein
VPFRWVCELRRDVVKPSESAEWHPEGTQRRGCGLVAGPPRRGGHPDQAAPLSTLPSVEVNAVISDIGPIGIAGYGAGVL